MSRWFTPGAPRGILWAVGNPLLTYCGRETLEPIEIARSIVDVLTERMGSDVLLLDLSGLTIITDYFVIVTGNSERQIRSLTSAVRQEIKETHNMLPLSVEGEADAGWVLMDYGSTVVHLFSEQQRDRYRLEELWSEARTVVRIA
ncbi:MAG: ribosome silencing factor [Anaerolineae bacterium]